MKVSIVIVNYNTSGDLDRCLESIGHSPPNCQYAVTVVDNASSEPEINRVVAKFPDVNWIMSEENNGFAKGSNIGINSLLAEWYLILNPDIVIQPGAFDRLLAYADNTPKAGLIGPQLLNDDGSIQESCRRFYSFKTLLMRRTLLGRLPAGKRIVDKHMMRDFSHLENRPVDWVIGGCVLVRHSAMDQVGQMDERFFLYFEDVDWCYRMWQSGWEVHYSADSRFFHRHRRDSASGPMKRTFWLHLFSMISFYEKWGVLVYLLKRWRDPLSKILMWSLDMLALNGAFISAYLLRSVVNPLFPENLYPLSEYRPLQLFASLLASFSFLMLGRYRIGAARRLSGLSERFKQVGVVSLLLLASTYLSHQAVYSRAVLLMFIPMFALTTTITERLFAAVRNRMEKGWLYLERTVLVGPVEDLRSWVRNNIDNRENGIDPVGYLADSPEADFDLPYLGTAEDMVSIVRQYRVSQVVFWRWPDSDFKSITQLAILREMRVRLRWRLDETSLLKSGARFESFADDSSAVLDPDSGRPAMKYLSRLLDLVAGLLVLFITVPGWLMFGSNRKFVTYLSSTGCSKTFRVACASDGSSKPVICQLPLFMEVVAGRISFIGDKPLLTAVDDGNSNWDLGGSKPSLAGRWSGINLRQCMSQFWKDPAGINSVIEESKS
jgi:N-acetylglucosaminyl-diphospho-decaprenol L-rhamnosyltransferase